MSRPEHSAPPEIFYNEAEAEKYTNNTRMMNIQVIYRLDIVHIPIRNQHSVQYIIRQK